MTDEKRQTDRAKLEAAVGKVAKAYHELVRVIEVSTDFKNEDVTKVFNFIAGVQNDSHQKAALSLKTAIAANGGFSLDKEYDAPTADPSQPAGRVVGQGKPRRAPVVNDDDDDGVGFVDS